MAEISNNEKDDGSTSYVNLCSICNSLSIKCNIHCNEEWYDCNNCKSRDVSIKNVPVSSIRNFRVKSKREVNPEMISICEHCNSSDLQSSECQWEQEDYCKNCKKYSVHSKRIPEYNYNSGDYKVKSRESINPEMIDICEHCNSNYLDFNVGNRLIYCSNCRRNVSGRSIRKNIWRCMIIRSYIPLPTPTPEIQISRPEYYDDLPPTYDEAIASSQ